MDFKLRRAFKQACRVVFTRNLQRTYEHLFSSSIDKNLRKFRSLHIPLPFNSDSASNVTDVPTLWLTGQSGA